jgi:hypothetical protein
MIDSMGIDGLSWVDQCIDSYLFSPYLICN